MLFRSPCSDGHAGSGAVVAPLAASGELSAPCIDGLAGSGAVAAPLAASGKLIAPCSDGRAGSGAVAAPSAASGKLSAPCSDGLAGSSGAAAAPLAASGQQSAPCIDGHAGSGAATMPSAASGKLIAPCIDGHAVSGAVAAPSVASGKLIASYSDGYAGSSAVAALSAASGKLIASCSDGRAGSGVVVVPSEASCACSGGAAASDVALCNCGLATSSLAAPVLVPLAHTRAPGEASKQDERRYCLGPTRTAQFVTLFVDGRGRTASAVPVTMFQAEVGRADSQAELVPEHRAGLDEEVFLSGGPDAASQPEVGRLDSAKHQQVSLQELSFETPSERDGGTRDSSVLDSVTSLGMASFGPRNSPGSFVEGAWTGSSAAAHASFGTEERADLDQESSEFAEPACTRACGGASRAGERLDMTCGAFCFNLLRSRGVRAMSHDGYLAEEIKRRGRWKSECWRTSVWTSRKRNHELAGKRLTSSISLLASLARYERRA